MQSQVRFHGICGYLTHGNPAEVFPALGFAARFRKICKNKRLRLLGIPPKLINYFLCNAEFLPAAVLYSAACNPIPSVQEVDLPATHIHPEILCIIVHTYFYRRETFCNHGNNVVQTRRIKKHKLLGSSRYWNVLDRFGWCCRNQTTQT